MPNSTTVMLKRCWPETYTADRLDKKSSAGVPGKGRDVPECTGTWPVGETSAEWAADFRDQPNVLSDVEACEAAHGNPFDWNLMEVSEALGPLLHKVSRGSAGVKLKAVSKIDGFNTWRLLAFWFQA